MAEPSFERDDVGRSGRQLGKARHHGRQRHGRQFRQGIDGAALDVVLLGRPWGFSLREIKPEVYLWQGEADTLVPPAMGSYQAAQIPHCHATMLPGEGHLLIIDRMPDLAAAFQQAR